MASILIIEDDDAIRSLLVTFLSAAGHTVREAADGNEGLRQYRAQPADLVITDMVMPEKEGLGTIMELRREYPQARIIAMSGGLAHNAGLYLHMAERLGAVRIMRKPFRLDELETIIAEALASGDGPPPPAPAT